MATSSDPAPDTDAFDALGPGGILIAVTDDGSDPRYVPVRTAAARVAAERRATLLLFCVGSDAAGVAGSSRVFTPGRRTGDGGPERPHSGSRRRDLLAAEAAELRQIGAAVLAWLPGVAGDRGIAEAVERSGAAAVMVPAERDRPGVVRRTLEYRAARIPAPLVAVDGSGGLRLVRPLQGGPRGALSTPLARARVLPFGRAT